MAFRLTQRSFNLLLVQIIVITALRRDEIGSEQGVLSSGELTDMPDGTSPRHRTSSGVVVSKRHGRVLKGKGASSGGGGGGGSSSSSFGKAWKLTKFIWRVPEFIAGISAGAAAVFGASTVAPDWVPFVRRRRAEAKPQEKGKEKKKEVEEEEEESTPTPIPTPAPSPTPAPTQKQKPARRRWLYKNCGVSWWPCPTGNCCALGSSCTTCKEGKYKKNHKECAWRGNRICVER
eukprot:TRINITY_DN5623_c0_g1_i1.p1 TRINITY_DN5623_c0_g1~~TRINITY_DN5623_c0_g1_i1.p1  ORF type:complete len:253 (-),score=40.64 TRINITY_DN5623_c0_g1_i1:69-767(-)